MASLDTSALLRWMLDDVPGAADAVQTYVTQCGRVVIADAAVVEAVFVLERVYKLTRPQIVLALSAVLGEAAFELDGSLWLEALADYLGHPKLSVADIYLTHRARTDGDGPLATFDRKLAGQLAGTLGLGEGE